MFMAVAPKACYLTENALLDITNMDGKYSGENISRKKSKKKETDKRGKKKEQRRKEQEMKKKGEIRKKCIVCYIFIWDVCRNFFHNFLSSQKAKHISTPDYKLVRF